MNNMVKTLVAGAAILSTFAENESVAMSGDYSVRGRNPELTSVQAKANTIQDIAASAISSQQSIYKSIDEIRKKSDVMNPQNAIAIIEAWDALETALSQMPKDKFKNFLNINAIDFNDASLFYTVFVVFRNKLVNVCQLLIGEAVKYNNPVFTERALSAMPRTDFEIFKNNDFIDFTGTTFFNFAAANGFIRTCELIISREIMANNWPEVENKLSKLRAVDLQILLNRNIIHLNEGTNIPEIFKEAESHGWPHVKSLLLTQGFTHAIQNGFVNACKYLIRNGADINRIVVFENDDGSEIRQPLLYFPASNTDLNMLKLLLENGAFPFTVEMGRDIGTSVLGGYDENATGDEKEIQDLLRPYVLLTQLRIVEFFEELEKAPAENWKYFKGIVANSRNNMTSTLLHLAAGYDKGKICEMFIDNGMDVNANPQLAGGRTPLHFAAMNNCVSAGQVLIGKGADINAPAGDGSTPLQHALTKNSKDMIELLTSKGAH